MITRGLKQWKRGKGRWTWASTSTRLYLSTQCLQNSNHSMHIAVVSITKRAFALRYWCSFIWKCEVPTQQLSITYFFRKSYFYIGIPVTLYLFPAFVGHSRECNFLSFSWFSDMWNAIYPCSSVFFSPLSLGQRWTKVSL